MYGFPPACYRPSPPAVAALRSELAGGSVPSEFRLLPAGAFRAPDGRPENLPDGWQLSDDDGRRLVAEAAARQSDLYIDYEHATLRAKTSGAPAPAAGWYKRLEWRPGDGLYVVGVEWVEAARKMIAAREYRYISPLFSYDAASGRVLHLLGASLTNDPGLDGLTDLAALAARLLHPDPPLSPRQETSMSQPFLLQALSALGLAATASESEALAALNTLKTQNAALSAQVNAAPDPAKYVPVATLSALQAEHAAVQGQLAALSAKVRAGEVDDVIAQARAAGKLPPALEGWAKDLGTKDLAALSAWVEAAPVVVKPGATQTGGKAPEGVATAALSADETKVCAQLGIKPEDFARTKAAA